MVADESTILVVDEDDITDLYATWLEVFYDVRRSTKATRHLKKLDDEVDVVLLDRRMPGLSGEVLEQIRTVTSTPVW